MSLFRVEKYMLCQESMSHLYFVPQVYIFPAIGLLDFAYSTKAAEGRGGSSQENSSLKATIFLA